MCTNHEYHCFDCAVNDKKACPWAIKKADEVILFFYKNARYFQDTNQGVIVWEDSDVDEIPECMHHVYKKFEGKIYKTYYANSYEYLEEVFNKEKERNKYEQLTLF